MPLWIRPRALLRLMHNRAPPASAAQYTSLWGRLVLSADSVPPRLNMHQHELHHGRQRAGPEGGTNSEATRVAWSVYGQKMVSHRSQRTRRDKRIEKEGRARGRSRPALVERCARLCNNGNTEANSNPRTADAKAAPSDLQLMPVMRSPPTKAERGRRVVNDAPITVAVPPPRQPGRRTSAASRPHS